MGCNLTKKTTKNCIIVNSPPPTIPSSPQIDLKPYALDDFHPASHLPEHTGSQKTSEESFEIADSISPGKFIKMKIVVLCQ